MDGKYMLMFFWGVIMGAGVVAIMWNDAVKRPTVPITEQTWVIKEGSCEVYMPHGKRRCVTGEVTMEGY